MTIAASRDLEEVWIDGFDSSEPLFLTIWIPAEKHGAGCGSGRPASPND